MECDVRRLTVTKRKFKDKRLTGEIHPKRSASRTGSGHLTFEPSDLEHLRQRSRRTRADWLAR